MVPETCVPCPLQSSVPFPSPVMSTPPATRPDISEFDEATKADPFIQEQLKLVNPLAKILTGGDADLGGQFAGIAPQRPR